MNIVTGPAFPDNNGFAGTLARFRSASGNPTLEEDSDIGPVRVKKYINEFWTSRQRQASSIHEISYRACFKPQLPRFFISLLTRQDDVVYDPFNGRGTTAVEAALLGRRVIANDANPLSRIMTQPRLSPPHHFRSGDSSHGDTFRERPGRDRSLHVLSPGYRAGDRCTAPVSSRKKSSISG